MTRKRWRLTKARREIIERAGFQLTKFLTLGRADTKGKGYRGSPGYDFQMAKKRPDNIGQDHYYLYNFETWDDVLELLVTHRMTHE